MPPPWWTAPGTQVLKDAVPSCHPGNSKSLQVSWKHPVSLTGGCLSPAAHQGRFLSTLQQHTQALTFFLNLSLLSRPAFCLYVMSQSCCRPHAAPWSPAGTQREAPCGRDHGPQGHRKSTADQWASGCGKEAASQRHGQVLDPAPPSICALSIHPAHSHPLTQIKIHLKSVWFTEKINQKLKKGQ